jgi:hypothetical protein
MHPILNTITIGTFKRIAKAEDNSLQMSAIAENLATNKI